jgi:hypothetical protein
VLTCRQEGIVRRQHPREPTSLPAEIDRAGLGGNEPAGSVELGKARREVDLDPIQPHLPCLVNGSSHQLFSDALTT